LIRATAALSQIHPEKYCSVFFMNIEDNEVEEDEDTDEQKR
jgi:hypothetical protein